MKQISTTIEHQAHLIRYLSLILFPFLFIYFFFIFNTTTQKDSIFSLQTTFSKPLPFWFPASFWMPTDFPTRLLTCLPPGLMQCSSRDPRASPRNNYSAVLWRTLLLTDPEHCWVFQATLEDLGILGDPCAFGKCLVGAGGRNADASHSPLSSGLCNLLVQRLTKFSALACLSKFTESQRETPD